MSIHLSVKVDTDLPQDSILALTKMLEADVHTWTGHRPDVQVVATEPTPEPPVPLRGIEALIRPYGHTA